jgi:hypothetical protein
MKVYFMLNLYIKHMINISIFLYIFGQIFKNLTSQKMRCTFIYGWRKYCFVYANYLIRKYVIST